jgi:hypothetical protein
MQSRRQADAVLSAFGIQVDDDMNPVPRKRQRTADNSEHQPPGGAAQDTEVPGSGASPGTNGTKATDRPGPANVQDIIQPHENVSNTCHHSIPNTVLAESLT